MGLGYQKGSLRARPLSLNVALSLETLIAQSMLPPEEREKEKAIR